MTLTSVTSQGQEVPRLVLPQGHTDKVVSMLFFGDRLISLDEGNTLILWDLNSQKEVNSIQFEVDVLSICEDISGNLVVALSGGGHLFFSTRNLSPQKTLKIEGAESSAFYRDNIYFIKKDVVYKHSDPEKKILEVKDVKLKIVNEQLYAYNKKAIYSFSKSDVNTVETHNVKGINELIGCTSDGHFISQDEKGILYLRSGKTTGLTLNKFFIPTMLNKVVWSEKVDEKTYCLSNEPMIYAFDEKLKLIHSFGFRDGKSSLGKLNEDGTEIAIAMDGQICIYETKSGKKSKSLQGNHSSITSLVPVPDKEALALSFANGELIYLPIMHEKESYFGKIAPSHREFLQGWRYLIEKVTRVEGDTVYFDAVKFKNDNGLVEKVETYEGYWNAKQDKYQLLKTKNKKIKKKKRVDVSSFVGAYTNGEKQLHLEGFDMDISKTNQNEITLNANGQELKILFFDEGEVLYKKGVYYYGNKDQSENIAFADGAGNIYHINQFDPYYNRPDKVFEGMPFVNSELIELYEKARLKRWSKIGITSETPDLNNIPLLEVNIPEQFEVNEAQCKIKVHSEDKNGLSSLHIYVNGVPEKGKNGELIDGKNYSEEKDIILNSGLNDLKIFTVNQEGVASNIVEFQLDCNVPSTPNLFVVSIGVSEYEQGDYSLAFAAKDADDFSKSFSKSTKEYESFSQLQLLNSDFNSKSTLEIKTFLSKASYNDVVIFYYAGHGALDEDLNYYLCPAEMNFSNPKEKGVSYEKIETLLSECGSRNKVLILDACHSGEIDAEDVSLQKTELETNEELTFRASGNAPKMNYSGTNVFDFSKKLFIDTRLTSGLMVITSSSGLEYSLEGENWNNGLFTYFVLEGLYKRQADQNNDGQIYLRELFLYVRENVNRCSSGQQTPTIREENGKVNVRIR